MEGRIITLHLKDVGEWGKPEARDVPLGTGLADYGAVLKELRRQGFKGVMGIEYEHDSPQLQEDVAACIAFVEKTAGELGLTRPAAATKDFRIHCGPPGPGGQVVVAAM